MIAFVLCGAMNLRGKGDAPAVSEDSRFAGKDFYPEFNWDVTPRYFMFGDGERVLSPKEVSSISKRTSFLCIEKSHASKQLGFAELGAKHDAAAFRKKNPDVKVLFYFNSAYAWPFTSYNQDFVAAKIDSNPELKSYLIEDPETGELARRGRTFFFDVLNPEFRTWWVDTVAKGIIESGCDGVFIDQMHGFVHIRKEKKDEIERAMGEMMSRLKQKIGPEKILLGNNATDEMARFVYPSIDASMFEHYSIKLTSKERLLRDWQDMERLAQDGKISVFRIGVEIESEGGKKKETRQMRNSRMAALSKERLEYYHACYLIGAQPYSYFQYGWGWRLDTGPLVKYPDLLRPLGAPQGAYQRVSENSWQFTREFEHASVWVDTLEQDARIDWH